MESLLCEVETPDLQGMAYHRVALQICHSYVSRSKRSDLSEIQKSHHDVFISVLGLSLDYRSDLDKAVECLRAPQSVKNQLKSVLLRVVNEMVDWLLELSETINVNFYDLNWCVWSNNGKIDHKRSAKKILSTANELSDKQKFAIMCEFCLEDELAQVNFDLKSTFRTNRLVEYWYRLIKNELSEMTRSKFRIASLETEMALCCLRHRHFQRWTAFEYFWHRIGVNEQFYVAKVLVLNSIWDFYHISTCHSERILGMMSHEQQRHLLSYHHQYVEAERLIRHRKDSLKSVRWALLTINIFTDTVKHLVTHKRHDDEWMNWLVELWDTASDQFKIHAAERTEVQSNVYHKLCGKMMWHCPCKPKVRFSRYAFKVYCRIILLKSREMRYVGVLKLACWLGTEINHDYLEDLIKAYATSTNDESKRVTKVSYVNTTVCLKLVQLLKSGAFAEESFCYQLSKWNVLNVFLDLMYPESSAVSLKIKQKLMTSCITRFPQSEDNDGQDVAKLIEIVESEFSKDDVKILKRSLVQSFRGMLIFHCDYFRCKQLRDEMYYKMFVKWCIGGGDRARDVRFVDAVFEEVLDVLNKFYKRPLPMHSRCWLDMSLLSNLDKCMFLVLINEEEMKEYKLGKVTSFDGFGIVQSIFMQNDELSKEKLLNWFFDNDQSAIRKFKSKKLKIE